jgi:hypothetical protein
MFLDRSDTMSDFLKVVDVEYGSVSGYAQQVLGLSEQDLETIRDNLMSKIGTIRESS